MTWLRRVRPVLFVLGVALVVGSLLGARALTNGNGQGNGEQPKTANPAAQRQARPARSCSARWTANPRRCRTSCRRCCNPAPS